MPVKRLPSLLLFLLTPVVIMATIWIMQPDQGQAALDLQHARLAQARNQPAEAAAALQRVVNKQPWRVDLYEQIGSLELQAGNVEAALAAFEKANQQSNLSVSGLLRLADLYTENGQYELAKNAVLYTVDSGQLPAADFEKALELIEKVGEAEDRLAVLSAWLIADPRNARVQYLNGVALSGWATGPGCAAAGAGSRRGGVSEPVCCRTGCTGCSFPGGVRGRAGIADWPCVGLVA